MKIGQILVHRNVIVRDQLREALRRQRQEGKPLGEILVRMGIVAPTDVVRALMTQPNASVDVQTLRGVEPETVAIIPEELAKELCCLALMRTEEILVIAMANPLDRAAIERIERTAGLSVVPVAAGPKDIAEVQASKYDSSAPDEAQADTSSSQGQSPAGDPDDASTDGGDPVSTG